MKHRGGASLAIHAEEISPAAGQAKVGVGISRRVTKAVPDRSTPDVALPGPSIAQQVKAEAEAKGQRRATARKLSCAHTPLSQVESIADRFRRLAREMEEDEAAAVAEAEAEERRARELDRLPTVSAVLRRAQRDWPQQCAEVQALAAELGVSLGEAWRRVIGAGVDCMRASADEAVA